MRRPADSSRLGAFDFSHTIRNLPLAELIQSQHIGILVVGQAGRTDDKRRCVRCEQITGSDLGRFIERNVLSFDGQIQPGHSSVQHTGNEYYRAIAVVLDDPPHRRSLYRRAPGCLPPR